MSNQTIAKAAPEPKSIDVSSPGTGTMEALMTMVYEVPRVLTMRIPKLVGETAIFSPYERTETQRAISEKSNAFVDGIAAAQAAALAACLTLQSETMSGRLMPWGIFDAMDSIVAASLAPSVDCLQANDDRLSAKA